MTKKLVIGNRRPVEYFVGSGIGESDLTDHAGSYDRALRNAGIEDFNFVPYSSLIPPDAKKVDVPKEYFFGSVLEGIMAVSTVNKGQRATAGLIKGCVYDPANKKVGYLVAEHNKNFEISKAKKNLNDCLKEMFTDRYPPEYKLREVEIVGLNSFVPKMEWGTILVVIGFTKYEYPVLKEH